MTIANPDPRQSAADVDPCWRVIGVGGDRSCAQLAELVHCHNCPVFADAGQRLLDRAPPGEYLTAQTAQLAHEADEHATGSEAVVVFKVAAEWLALDVAAVVEVAPPRAVHRIPYRSNDIFAGITNLRGELQLCVSLPALLGMGCTSPAGTSAKRSPALDTKQRLLVCQRAGDRWAFTVDEVAGVWRVRLDQLGNVPATIARGPLRLTNAIFDWNGRRVGRLDGDRLFASLQESIG
ncbi:MAG: chemotaxis protein CheW [Planctomycetaceae bacterium]|nr:chemotaxis protein CheW [Planctomycetaceae bacterium]